MPQFIDPARPLFLQYLICAATLTVIDLPVMGATRCSPRGCQKPARAAPHPLDEPPLRFAVHAGGRCAGGIPARRMNFSRIIERHAQFAPDKPPAFPRRGHLLCRPVAARRDRHRRAGGRRRGGGRPGGLAGPERSGLPWCCCSPPPGWGRSCCPQLPPRGRRTRVHPSSTPAPRAWWPTRPFGAAAVQLGAAIGIAVSQATALAGPPPRGADRLAATTPHPAAGLHLRHHRQAQGARCTRREAMLWNA